MTEAKGSLTTPRGRESMAFLAFIFAAVATFGLSLIQELPACVWLRILIKVIFFPSCFYVFMMNVRVRNKVLAFYSRLKVENG